MVSRSQSAGTILPLVDLDVHVASIFSVGEILGKLSSELPRLAA